MLFTRSVAVLQKIRHWDGDITKKGIKEVSGKTEKVQKEGK